jgi:hypothetical protein
MLYYKIVRSIVVAASLVAMVVVLNAACIVFAEEFPPPSSSVPVLSPQWDLTTLTVYESSDAAINVTIDCDGNPLFAVAIDQDASSRTFTFSVVSDDGFESMFVSGEVLVDGSIYYQTVNAYLAAATSSAGGVLLHGQQRILCLASGTITGDTSGTRQRWIRILKSASMSRWESVSQPGQLQPEA